jgi:plasmid replication initiation protein
MTNLAELRDFEQGVLFLHDDIGILRNVVTQSNKLVRSRYRLTHNENRIVKMLISTVQPNDQDFKFYKFKTSYVVKVLGLKSKGNYSAIIKTIEGLMEKTFTIIENDRAVTLAWLASAEYLPDKGVIEIELSQKLKPYLLNLRGSFTQVQLAHIMALRSYHSSRVYEIIKSYDIKRTNQDLRTYKFTIRLEELRWQLGFNPEEYPRYSNFKQRVLLPAQKEINDKTDITFQFEEIKISQKTESLLFHVSTQENRRNMIKNIFSLKQFDLTNIQLDKLETCFEGHSEEEIIKIAAALEQAQEDGKIRSPINYLLSNPQEIIDAILNDYFLPDKPQIKKTNNEYELYIPDPS